tara:strand:- start:1047 stop:1376 length:330 start_codon:yes stop_codon:yes gene_type:complete
MPLLNVSLKLPNGNEDKIFEQILNEVEIDSIPTKFIHEIHIKLNNGKTVKVGKEFLKQIKTTDDMFSNTDLRQFEDQVVDIEIYLNIDHLKGVVQKNVGKILTKYFKDS